MAVRLNKVAKELGVGISTLVDHLAKKGVTVEANPNTQISDEQHDILVSAFSKDLREAADEKIAQGHNKSNKANKQTSVAIEGYGENSPKKEEPKKAEKPEKAEAKNVSSIKIVDKIDLDALNKKKAKLYIVSDNKARHELLIRESEILSRMGSVSGVSSNNARIQFLEMVFREN